MSNKKDFEIDFINRVPKGSGESRRLRRTGWVPAVIYGAGEDVEYVAVKTNILTKQMSNEAFFSHILELTVNGSPTQAVIKEVQREPASQKIIHVDFMRVSALEELVMNVPLHFMNADDAPGVKEGGILNSLMNDIEIKCLPRDLPEYLEVDVAELGIGDSISLSEIKFPEGVAHSGEIEEDKDQAVVTIAAPVIETEEEDVTDEEEGVGEEGEEGEKATDSESSED